MHVTETQLNIWIPNVPGELAKLTDKLRAADVNIDALSVTSINDKETIVHMIVDDMETAKIVLQPNLKVQTSDILVFRLKNEPGAIARISRMCAGGGLNIRQVYASTNGKEAMVYVGVDDIEKAKQVFGGKK